MIPNGAVMAWVHDPVMGILLGRKHAFSILLYLYQMGTASTSDLIRMVRGHPASIIKTLRALESLGAIARVWIPEGRLKQARLTVRGIQILETPANHWGRLVRKWDRLGV